MVASPNPRPALPVDEHTLLRGTCPLWTATAPITARAEWVAARSTTILATLVRL